MFKRALLGYVVSLLVGAISAIAAYATIFYNPVAANLDFLISVVLSSLVFSIVAGLLWIVTVGSVMASEFRKVKA